MILNREQILKANDIQIEQIAIPEWGGTVYIRGLNGSERDRFEDSVVQQRGKNQTVNMKNVRSKLAVMSLCDDKGNLIFTESDILELSKKSAVALNRIFDVASRLSGLTKDEVDTLAKNLDKNPNGDSTSD